MNLLRMTTREMLHRRGSFVAAVLAVVVASAALTGARDVLKVFDRHTRTLLLVKEQQLEATMRALIEDMRKATLELSFNVVILPEDQELRDWYAHDYATKTMPEEYVMRLADSGIVTVRHFLPSLQQRITWPEKNQTIILVGTRGEVPNLHKNPRKPLVEPVARGTIVLGHELQRRLTLKEGDLVTLMGREFTVSKCHAERGNKDDITAWIHLSEAQELLDQPGRINAILALQCLCPSVSGLMSVRHDIVTVLPNTQVIEQGTKILARAEARGEVGRQAKAALDDERAMRERLRAEREGLMALFVPLVIAACALWIGLIFFGNVRERRDEVGILRTLGFGSGQIMSLFLGKAVVTGLAGGILGYLAGRFCGLRIGQLLEGQATGAVAGGFSIEPAFAGIVLLVAVSLALVCSWLPAVMAARQNPAEVLHEE